MKPFLFIQSDGAGGVMFLNPAGRRIAHAGAADVVAWTALTTGWPTFHHRGGDDGLHFAVSPRFQAEDFPLDPGHHGWMRITPTGLLAAS